MDNCQSTYLTKLEKKNPDQHTFSHRRLNIKSRIWLFPDGEAELRVQLSIPYQLFLNSDG
jgi:hypothetical protein